MEKYVENMHNNVLLAGNFLELDFHSNERLIYISEKKMVD